MKHEFTCSVCGLDKVHDDELTTGYAIDKDQNKVCFSCCGIQDAKELKELPYGKTIAFYLTKDKTGNWRVCNWPASFIVPVRVPVKGLHNIARYRYDIWFSYEGNKYHGTQYGDNSEIVRIRKVKK